MTQKCGEESWVSMENEERLPHFCSENNLAISNMTAAQTQRTHRCGSVVKGKPPHRGQLCIATVGEQRLLNSYIAAASLS